MRVLVVYYSQTGQLTEIVNSVLSPLVSDLHIQLDFEEVRPSKPYPFPWNAKQFFDAFPESFMEIKCEMAPTTISDKASYDLIIIAYQTWYLSISIPISSFLQSERAKEMFKNTPVVTVVGCRNMWLSGQEKMKRRLRALGANLVGNIVFYDKAYNLVSVYTILRWMLYGKKGNSGVSKKDIGEAPKFGEAIKNSLLSGNLENLHSSLLNLDAVHIIPNLTTLEKTANKLFAFWAKFVLVKGGPGDPNRRARLNFFALYLLNGIVLLSPLTTIIFYVTSVFRLAAIKADISYLENVEYEENRFISN
ncbi:MAG: dialkylresorcinol condensing enzyme DarA [Bacteroidetes bacterium]|nr:MAG: dialkylresorcinol condensing enzyme DarA [Bacteroidota bacterium]